MSSLILGPVIFADFELPESIRFGGRQRLAIHQLPGGQRVIDAMGADDSPIAWSGIFSGPDATSRARTLDLLRIQGLPQQVMWGDFAYTVIVSFFSAEYQRATWVPYRISCVVLADAGVVLSQVATTFAASLLADLGAAAGLAPLDVTAATTALGMAGVGTRGSAANGAAVAALAATAAAVTRGLSASGAALGSTAPFSTIAEAAQQSAQFAAAQGFVQRAQGNLANVGS